MSGVSSEQGESKSVAQVSRHQDKRQRYSSLTLPNQNIPVTHAQETCCDHGLDTDMRPPSSRSESWVSSGVGASQGQPVPHSILKRTHGPPDTKHRITPRFSDIIELVGNSRVQIIKLLQLMQKFLLMIMLFFVILNFLIIEMKKKKTHWS